MIIALEGLGASGKTSFIQELDSNKYFIIPEIRDIIAETGITQAFTSNDHLTANVNEWFLRLEEERTNRALLQTKTVIMERCFISQIAYNFAKDRILHTNYSKILADTAKEYKLIIPYIIYLEVSPDESLQRMLNRNKHNERENILNLVENYTIEFNSHIAFYYENLKKYLIKIC